MSATCNACGCLAQVESLLNVSGGDHVTIEEPQIAPVYLVGLVTCLIDGRRSPTFPRR